MTGVEEIGQAVRERVRLIRGEAKFKAGAGIPHFEGSRGEPSIFTKGLPTELIANVFMREILEIPGIVEMTEIDLTQDDNQRARRVAELTFSALGSVDDALERIPINDTVSVAAG